jgi:hypothetical protein
MGFHSLDIYQHLGVLNTPLCLFTFLKLFVKRQVFIVIDFLKEDDEILLDFAVLH